jgi:hypothetical protein
VSCRLACELLNIIVVVADPDCPAGVVVGVVDIMGDVDGVVDADEAGGVGISAVVMDVTV